MSKGIVMATAQSVPVVNSNGLKIALLKAAVVASFGFVLLLLFASFV